MKILYRWRFFLRRSIFSFKPTGLSTIDSISEVFTMDLLALIVQFSVFFAWMNELFKPPKKPEYDEKFGQELTKYIKEVAKNATWKVENK